MKSVACPRCGAQSPYSPENAWRPFCSERCRTIDLGAWATESYRIPVSPAADGDGALESEGESDKPG